jgi:hypothetical protein
MGHSLVLKIRPKPHVEEALQPPATNAFDLCASPFIDESELWLDALLILHSWLHKRFKGRTYFGDYEMAKALDVHRVIADAWLAGLVRAGLASHVIVGLRNGNEANATTLKGKPAVKDPRVVVPEELESYDPWTNRDYDEELPDALYADLYIDKYFEVCSNEYFLIERKLRTRGSHYFEVVSVSEHPRYANQGSRSTTPAPESWKDIIEALATGEKTNRRNR